MDASEPEYTYVKGEGWVPCASGNWKVLYRSDSRRKWENVEDGGKYFDRLGAEARMQQSLTRYKRNIEHYNWEYKIVRAEDFPE
jgi:hypothetical protein